MRLIHTSDWHLGRSFGDHPLLDDQRAFCGWFVDTVAETGAQLVIIAGDIYDRSVPPAEAVELFAETLTRLVALGIDVVAISGNHDSAARLGVFDGITDASGVFIRGGFVRAGHPIDRTYADGRLRILPVPFLSPGLVPPGWLQRPSATEAEGVKQRAAETATSENEPASAGRNGRPSSTDLVSRALRITADTADASPVASGATRSVVVAHDFVAGGLASDSERDLLIGGLTGVDSAVFDGHSYVALGHLHRPQTVGGNPNIRYSGSPLAYSFSEDHPKSIVQVDLAADGTAATREIPVTVGRAARTVTGLFADIMAEGSTVVDGSAGSTARDTEDWIRVQLTDATPIRDAARQLRGRFPRLVEVEMVNRHATRSDRPPLAEIKALSAAELAARFYADVTGQPLSGPQRAGLDELVADIEDAAATA